MPLYRCQPKPKRTIKVIDLCPLCESDLGKGGGTRRISFIGGGPGLLWAARTAVGGGVPLRSAPATGSSAL